MTFSRTFEKQGKTEMVYNFYTKFYISTFLRKCSIKSESLTFLNKVTLAIFNICLFNVREKNASFSSLIVRSYSILVMLYASKYFWNLREEESAFFATVGPISVKYLLKFSAIDFISAISFFLQRVFLEMIADNFFLFL